MIPHSPPDLSGPTVAIIGSGPSGCYTAHFLSKELPGAQICIFEALPVPYGLVRYGVAADHQGTKAVSQQFDRMFDRGQATFVGNVRVGDDISFEAVARAFDVVVIATGMPRDRLLPVPQDDSARVVGAGGLLRALNGFPVGVGQHGAPATQPVASLGRDIVVVGHGNVAVDTVRLLAKQSEELVGSDIDDRVLRLLRPEPLRSVRLVGRSSVENAKFDLAMVRELCQLAGVEIRTEGLHDAARGAMAELLRGFADENRAAYRPRGREAAGGPPRTRVIFHFEEDPAGIRHTGGVTSIDVRCGASGTLRTYAADTIITAIGFCQSAGQHAGIPNETWSGRGVYRVGWIENGARGNLAENRKHAQGVAKKIVEQLGPWRAQPSRRAGLPSILPQLQKDPTNFSSWRLIDAIEKERAGAGRCRRKITSIAEMVSLAEGSVVNV